ncbi:hypothetical protein BJ322DRAFT_1021289 [Thelephora terrestris]|uniref:Uncharacterized protein n=1 Tax=Thelephora terrestris TaxID=56493 RepID=A0A9P6HDH2_9AGAM|nr:hypothetical protein BJ322DRAFT_1021289 [Thelephora terrestris]
METNITNLQVETLASLKSYADAAKVSAPITPPPPPPPSKPPQPKPPLKRNLLPQAVIQTKGKTDPKSLPSFVDLVTTLNKSLHKHPKHSHVRVVGVKWTAASNLVVCAEAPSPSALVNTLKGVQASITSNLLIIKDIIPNTRWSRVTLSHVFTGKEPDSPAYSPEALHEELFTHNPNYMSFIIRQYPSWIRNPKNFTNGQTSSISFAFEDPDGTHAQCLIGTSLTAFGNLRCTLKAWVSPKKTAQKP